MTILLTNDDGVEADGMRALQEALSGLDDLVVTAPLRNNSGVGHAISLHETVRIRRLPPAVADIPRIAVEGTPADAVKYGVQEALDAPPALVVSGINNGPNVGINVHYSGTAGAALEAVMLGVPAVAVSMDHKAIANWETGKHFARQVVEMALAMTRDPACTDDLGRAFCLNLNVPDHPVEEVKGLRLTRHGESGFREVYHPINAEGDEFRIEGDMTIVDPDDTYDAAAVAAGYASLTPLRIDLTDPDVSEYLRGRM